MSICSIIFLIDNNIHAFQKQLFLDLIVHGNHESVQRLIQIWEEVPLTRTVSIEWKKKSLDFLNAYLAPDISTKDYRMEIFAIQQQLEKLKNGTLGKTEQTTPKPPKQKTSTQPGSRLSTKIDNFMPKPLINVKAMNSSVRNES